MAPRGAWDVEALEARYPEIAGVDGHRLGDAPPYWVPASNDRLALFLCRFELDRPIRVSLPPDQSDVERETIELALRAWEGVIPGLHFEPVTNGAFEIEIRFLETPEEPVLTGVGDTVADCAFRSVGSVRVDARLVYASIHLRRELYDVAGRRWTLDPDELLGGLLHELGHALGYSGHARRRDSIMNLAPGEVRRIARRVQKGEGLDAPTLEALYALPSGIRVGSLSVDPEQLSIYARMLRVGRDTGLVGPFARTGERSSRMIWRTSDGVAAGSLVVLDWLAALRDSARFELEPTPLARARLVRAAD